MSSNKRIIVFFLVSFLIACSPTLSTHTATPFVPTKTSMPVPTSTPTILPTATPSFDGPKLIYKLYQEGLRISVEMMNKDGTSRKTLLSPNEGKVLDLSDALSPDGKWLAFHSGTIDDRNVTLNILSISSAKKQAITYLLSKDYPDNFQKAIDKIRASNTDLAKNDEITVDTISVGFDIGFTDWSPDSRYLAFTGEMDGPTSDLYVYDMQEKIITRLTDDLLNIGRINWSPDGKQIYFNNGIQGKIYGWNIYYSINFDSKKIQALDIPSWGQYDGCIEQFCLSHYQGDGGDPRDISLTNMSTGISKILWPQSFERYAIAPRYHGIAVSGYSHQSNHGTYFVGFDGTKKKLADLYFSYMTFFDASKPLFISGRPDGIFTITFDGEVKKVYDTSYYLFKNSPDNHIFVAYLGSRDDSQAKGLVLFDENSDFIRKVGEDQVIDVLWRPDSQGLFYRSEKSAYYLPMLNGDPIPLAGEYISFSETVWIP